ncbi:hypothetical protein TNCV_3070101 [Trichonephila clavipes]|nr:hypothetical protein TNCV_3070101 [Trichonephila clavipes]
MPGKYFWIRPEPTRSCRAIEEEVVQALKVLILAEKREPNYFVALLSERILGGDQGYTPEIMSEILTTARDLELEVNEEDIEDLIMGHEDELRQKNSKKF